MSTKTADRKLAMQVAQTWEREAKLARRGAITEDRVRRVLSDFHEVATGRRVQFFTARGWLEAWKKNVQGTAAARTISRYSSAVDSFVKHLGQRADLSLETVTQQDVQGWRDSLKASGLSSATTNQEIKILKLALKEAHEGGLIPTNPAALVRKLQDTHPGAKRDAFSVSQVKALLEAAGDTDWRGFVLLGATAGLRLRDAADLEWGAPPRDADDAKWTGIDLKNGIMRIVTGKRGAVVLLPIHPALAAWLKSRPRGKGKEPVLPSLHGKSGAGKSGLSTAFGKLMKAAGIAPGIVREGTGAGRTTSALSAHSLRHFYVSQLAAGGVGADVRMRLAGHADAKSHATYAAHEIESLRAAVALLPEL